MSEASQRFEERGLVAALRRLDARSRRALTGMTLRAVFYGAVAFIPCLLGSRAWADGAISIEALTFLGAAAAFIIAQLRRERLDAPSLNYWTEGLLLLAIGLFTHIVMRHPFLDI